MTVSNYAADLKALKKKSIDKQMETYAQMLADLEADANVASVLAYVAHVEKVKAHIVGILKTDARVEDTPEDEIAVVDSKSLEVRFSKKVTTRGLIYSVDKTIEDLGLDVCLPAISISASSLETELGRANSKDYVEAKLGARKVISVKLK